MIHLDPLFLSRLQFAWVIAFHILLPAFTIGLASFIAVLEGMNFLRIVASICVSPPFGQKYLRFRLEWGWCQGSLCPFSLEQTGVISRMQRLMFYLPY